MSDKNSRRPAPRSKKPADTSFLQGYLDSLGLVRPSIHINGTQHPTAVITVDLGQPLMGHRLQQEHSQELVTRLRRLTRDLYQNDVNIRVSFDNNGGVFWSSVA